MKNNDWDLFAAALSVKDQKLPPGPGWITFIEITQRLGKHPNNVSKQMNIAVRAGRFERFDGIMVRDGNLVRSAWFRPIKKK